MHSLLPNDNLFKSIFDFTTAGDWDCVAAVEPLPALHYSVDLFSCPFGSRVSFGNFGIIIRSLMRPKWSKVASLAKKTCTQSFSSSVHSLLPKDNLFKNIFEGMVSQSRNFHENNMILWYYQIRPNVV